MRWIQRTRDVSLHLFCLCIVLPAQAITIDVDFASGTLFSVSADAQAKATINAAAADISAAITSSLNAVTTDMYTGMSGSANATVDWNANYYDPIDVQQLNPILVPNATLAADTVKIFVDTSTITGSLLGQGGPNIGLEFSVTSVPEWALAVADAMDQSEVAYTRGGGPVMGTIGGSATISGVTSSYSADYGAAFGNVWFDVESGTNWHFNHDSNVVPGTSDLYSVALHEILHAIGIGPSTSWKDLTSGTTWNGTEVQVIIGSGANLVHADDSHIASSVMSTRISDGMPQEVVMDPNITEGTRKELTVLDLAFLRDIGYQTIIPTFPPDYDGDNDVDAADLAFWQTWYGMGGTADADDDGDTDGADFLVWQRAYTGPLVAVATASVPEPSTAVLLLTVLVAARLRFRTM